MSDTPKWYNWLARGQDKATDHHAIAHNPDSPFTPDANERIYGKRVRDPSLPTVEEAKILSDYIRQQPYTQNSEVVKNQVMNMAAFMAAKRALEGGE